MASSKDEIAQEFLALGIRQYKDGRVEREKGTEIAPPSLHPITGVESKNVVINPDTNLSARIYLPKITNPDQKLPVLIYFHGGGFCIESAFSPIYHTYCNAIAAEATAVVVSVNYRLAPEHPVPIPFNDSWEAVNWVVSHSKENSDEPWLRTHADFDRVFFAGDSAGGTIAHNMAIRVGSEGLNGANLVGIILIHPYFWGNEAIGGEPTDVNLRNFIVSLWRFSCPESSGVDDPLMNPVLDPKFSDLGCEKVLICVAEKDMLKDRGWDYYEKLGKTKWGGKVEILEAKGEPHVFHLFNPDSENAVDMLKRVGSLLNSVKA